MLTTLKVASMNEGFQMPLDRSITRTWVPSGNGRWVRSARVRVPPCSEARSVTVVRIRLLRIASDADMGQSYQVARPSWPV